MRVRNKTILLIISIVLSASLFLSGCMAGSSSSGWAGGTVSDGTLFVASMNGKVIAIDAESGTVLSYVQLALPSAGGLGCVPTCGQSSSVPLSIYTSPVTDGETVFVAGSNDNVIYGLSFDGERMAEFLETETSGAVIGDIVISDEKLYFATTNGVVCALAVDNLKDEYWSVDIGSKIWSAPAIEGDTLYVGTLDRKIYALDATNGDIIWEYETIGAISSTPIVYDNKVYVGDYARNFYALNAANGNPVWTFPPEETDEGSPDKWFWAEPLILDGIVYASNLDGNIYALDALNGNLVHKYVMGDAISSSPVIIEDSIVVATTNLSKNTSTIYVINTTDKSQMELESLTEGINAPLFAKDDVVYVHTSNDNLYGININTKTKQTFNLATAE